MPEWDRPGRFAEEAVAHIDGLFGYALSLSRDRTVAEDLVQEAYVRALAAANKPAPGENLRGWLFTILHNIWRNHRRRQRPEPLGEAHTLERLEAAGKDPQEALADKETFEHIQAAIDELPRPFQEVITLCCVQGFSYKETADIVGCPAGTVMSRLARARALLRKRLLGTEVKLLEAL